MISPSIVIVCQLFHSIVLIRTICILENILVFVVIVLKFLKKDWYVQKTGNSELQTLTINMKRVFCLWWNYIFKSQKIALFLIIKPQILFQDASLLWKTRNLGIHVYAASAELEMAKSGFLKLQAFRKLMCCKCSLLLFQEITIKKLWEKVNKSANFGIFWYSVVHIHISICQLCLHVLETWSMFWDTCLIAFFLIHVSLLLLFMCY